MKLFPKWVCVSSWWLPGDDPDDFILNDVYWLYVGGLLVGCSPYGDGV